MASVTASLERPGVLRNPWDALLIALAIGQGAVLLALPCWPVVALGLWWNSNTIAHYAIHCPFLRRRTLNGVFAFYLSVLLGVPQALWRDRHLAHHAGVTARLRWRPQLIIEIASILVLWSGLLLLAPTFLVFEYAPGYALGLSLCFLHGHYEHARGTTSHYGRLYNWLFFNDGYHVEHHASPTAHWTELPRRVKEGAVASRWPAVLRWLECLGLNSLERWVLVEPRLQGLLLRTHERAFRRLLPALHNVKRIGIVGGGMFPRTVLICQRLFPEAELVVIDGSAANVATAQRFLQGAVVYLHDWYEPRRHAGFDLLIIPLAFVGERQRFYERPPAPAVLVHDWIWRRRGQGAVVSWLLCKRLNLVRS